MLFFDAHPSVLQWASEAIRIPYVNPVTGEKSSYVPDFFVLYEDKDGNRVAEMVEVKPRNQSVIEGKANAARRAVVAVNQAKWEAAKHFCARNGIRFRVATEDDIYVNPRKRR